MNDAALYAQPARAKKLRRPFMRRKLGIGLGLLLATATTVPAWAQPSTSVYPTCAKTVSTNDSDLAHQKYFAGKQDFDESNWDSAIRRFKDAYNLDCTKHELLIIIAAAYERKGDKREAVAALEAYVNRAPTAPDVGTYQGKIENLKKQIAAAPPPSASTTAPPPAQVEMQEHTPYPWIVVGLGGAGIAVGVAVLVTAPKFPPGCNETDRNCTRGEGESAEAFKDRQEQAGKSVDQERGGTIVIAAGAIVAIGGLVWHFLEPTGPKESTRASVRPAFSPGYAGLSLGGTF